LYIKLTSCFTFEANKVVEVEEVVEVVEAALIASEV
jgi:hypothetical protein